MSTAPQIMVVSDGRGETGTQVLRAALVQFERQRHYVLTRANIRSAREVEQVMQEAAARQAVVLYTLVGDETRQAMVDCAREHLVPTVDVLGPALSALHDLFQRSPGSTPGLLYASNRDQFDRHAAIDYTLTHDDGQRQHELDEADVVLVGVSRTAKSSTCFYLAYEGIKAANVPLLPGVPSSEALTRVDPGKVIGLRVNVMRLMTVRAARARHLELPPQTPYLDKHAISREVIEANQLMDQQGWRSFDASYMAIEEIARRVRRLRGI